MNGDIFLKWLGHFQKHVQISQNNPALLILDGHASHKELPVIKYARNHYIHMLSCSPHISHKLKPLDRSFMKPFNAAFSEASAKWMRMNPGAKITDINGIK